jgi:hypothetical protein
LINKKGSIHLKLLLLDKHVEWKPACFSSVSA